MSLRVAIIGRIVIIVIFFSVAVVWLLSNEDIGIYR